MKIKKFTLAAGLLFLLAACASDPYEASDVVVQPTPSFQTITASEARQMMAEADNYVLLDVRTEAEFREKRITGAILIPYNEIRERAEAELPDKNAVILVYCRSGRRSALAAATLAALGFVNVYDFGGIIDWPYEYIGD